MPIFEFVCTDCERSFEELLRNSEAVSGVVCPKCGGAQVRKKLSAFASKISGGGSFSLRAPSASSCGGGT